ncbi:MAG: hypothetical protein DRP86_00050 [Candidatus Neomarinimicrobiota bacterium]|nr:hypothetical protein [Candidatus Neomarinimicrobiota bacterium]RKY51783.1 MAG: hypothetical protein DRP86_00050 [Candidatus Neomarinimicrobiota bacterium]
MKKKKERDRSFKLPLKILWFFPGLTGLGGLIAAIYLVDTFSLFFFVLVITLLYIGFWIYLTLRIFRFNKRLVNYFRRLLSGDFSTGIHDISWIDDEITLITNLATKVAEHLETYDTLRADRTALSLRALEVLFRRASRKIIMADFDKSVFKFTKPLQQAFGVEQDIFSFNVIEKQPNNERFFRQFLLAALKDAQVKEFTATLELPIRNSSLELKFKFVPIKDRSEKVRIAFLYVDNPDDDPDD